MKITFSVLVKVYRISVVRETTTARNVECESLATNLEEKLSACASNFHAQFSCQDISRASEKDIVLPNIIKHLILSINAYAINGAVTLTVHNLHVYFLLNICTKSKKEIGFILTF